MAMFLGSSAVEQATVNRPVAGSNPARGAILDTVRNVLITLRNSIFFYIVHMSLSHLTTNLCIRIELVINIAYFNLR